MDLGLGDAAVLITGGNRGIGRAIALAFAREGARVAICGRSRDALAETEQAVQRLGGKCLSIQKDLSDPEGSAEAVQRTVDEFGGLQVLVNNASLQVDDVPRALEDISDQQALGRINGKLLLAIRCARAAIPFLRADGGGRIVNIAGVTARSVFRDGELPGQGSGLPQALGNASIAAFSKHLSEALVGSNVLVNVVHPHVVRTDRHLGRVAEKARELGITEAEADKRLAAQIPLGRNIEVDDISPLVVFLASAKAAAISGQSIAVDGGASRSIMY